LASLRKQDGPEMWIQVNTGDPHFEADANEID